MSIEQGLEQDFKQDSGAKPDLYVVPPVDEETRKAGQTTLGDCLVGITIDVNGVPRSLRVNVSKGTLGNDQSITSYFERFEAATKKRDQYGNIVGDFDMAERLAGEALRVAQRVATVSDI